MQQPAKNESAEKENNKVKNGNPSDDKPVQEGQPNSIRNEDTRPGYTGRTEDEIQLDTQEEFIDRNSNSKDKG